MPTAREALVELKEGNERFVYGSSNTLGAGHRGPVTETAPIAIVLGCSDPRVPVETVFAQPLGSLFVVRVAGNIAGPSQVGSIELAVETMGPPLLVVLGHSMCGAVIAALEALRDPSARRSPNLQKIVDAIQPAVRESLGADSFNDWEALIGRSVRANVRASMDRLLQSSALLRRQVHRGRLTLLGAEYTLETGVVQFVA